MSITTTFENLIKSEDYFKALFDEFKFDLILENDIQRVFKRTTYKIYDLQCINFPAALLSFVEDLLSNNNIKTQLSNYKFIEYIYYSVNLINTNNKITIETSIDKKYDEYSINEFDKIMLSILLMFIENGYTSYVKNEIFKKNMSRINLHSFELSIT